MTISFPMRTEWQCRLGRDGQPTESSVRLGAAAARRLEVELSDYVGLSVCDAGVGITDDIRKRAIGSFCTTKAVGKGRLCAPRNTIRLQKMRRRRRNIDL
jgi:hypothetical protein